MNLNIKIDREKVFFLLLGGKKIQDKIEMGNNKKISQKMLSQIDKLLKKNKLGLSDLKKINLQSNMGSNFTSVRIAQVTTDLLNWAKNKK